MKNIAKWSVLLTDSLHGSLEITADLYSHQLVLGE